MVLHETMTSELAVAATPAPTATATATPTATTPFTPGGDTIANMDAADAANIAAALIRDDAEARANDDDSDKEVNPEDFERDERGYVLFRIRGTSKKDWMFVRLVARPGADLQNLTSYDASHALCMLCKTYLTFSPGNGNTVYRHMRRFHEDIMGPLRAQAKAEAKLRKDTAKKKKAARELKAAVKAAAIKAAGSAASTPKKVGRPKKKRPPSQSPTSHELPVAPFATTAPTAPAASPPTATPANKRFKTSPTTSAHAANPTYVQGAAVGTPPTFTALRNPPPTAAPAPAASLPPSTAAATTTMASYPPLATSPSPMFGLSTPLPTDMDADSSGLNQTHGQALLINWLNDSLRPIDVVEDAGFVEYSKYLAAPSNSLYASSFEIPSRAKIEETIAELSEKSTKIIKECMQSEMEHFSLEVDMWCLPTADSPAVPSASGTSSPNQQFIAITAHYLTDTFQPKSVVLDVSKLSGTDMTEKQDASSGVVKAFIERALAQYGLFKNKLVMVLCNTESTRQACAQLSLKHMDAVGHGLHQLVGPFVTTSGDNMEAASNKTSTAAATAVAPRQLQPNEAEFQLEKEADTEEITHSTSQTIAKANQIASRIVAAMESNNENEKPPATTTAKGKGIVLGTPNNWCSILKMIKSLVKYRASLPDPVAVMVEETDSDDGSDADSDDDYNNNDDSSNSSGKSGTSGGGGGGDKERASTKKNKKVDTRAKSPSSPAGSNDEDVIRQQLARLSEREWSFLEGMALVLGPFELAVELLRSSNCATLAEALPIIATLKQYVEKTTSAGNEETDAAMKKFFKRYEDKSFFLEMLVDLKLCGSALLSGFARRYDVVKPDTLFISMFDYRRRKMRHLPPSVYEECKANFTDQVFAATSVKGEDDADADAVMGSASSSNDNDNDNSKVKDTDDSTNSKGGATTQKQDESDDDADTDMMQYECLFASLDSPPSEEVSDKATGKDSLQKRHRSAVEMEVSNYLLSNLRSPPRTSPPEWWKTNGRLYPNLAIAARKWLCIPAVANCSDRVFAGCGSKLARAASSPSEGDTMMKQVFLHANKKVHPIGINDLKQVLGGEGVTYDV